MDLLVPTNRYVNRFLKWNYGTIKDSFVKDITFDGDGDTYPLSQSFTGSHIENTYYLSEKTEDKNAKTAQQFASGEVCSLLNHGVTEASIGTRTSTMTVKKTKLRWRILRTEQYIPAIRNV